MPTIANKNPDDDSSNNHEGMAIKEGDTVTAFCDMQLPYPPFSLLFN